MGLLILKVLAIWTAVGLVACLALGAAVRRADRARKDTFLNCVFDSLESLRTFRSK
jgi:hypothetical protein